MASVPSLFSRQRSSTPNKNTTGAPTGTSSQPAPKVTIPVFTVSGSKDQPPSKKPKRAGSKPKKDSNEVANIFGGIADASITADELESWKQKSDMERDNWLSKAGLELIYHLHEKEAESASQTQQLKDQETEIAKLKKEANSFNAKMKKVVDARDAATAEKARLEGAVFEKDNRISQLEASLSKLQLEKDEQVKGWAAEKESLIDASFADGMNSYIATFLAGDPKYDWTPKFGKGISAYIAEFPTKNAELVAGKKKDLEGVLAAEAQDPSANEPEARLPSSTAEMEVDINAGKGGGDADNLDGAS